jgi:ABC-type multidrug transport system fused ATPase/permease subunit
MFYQSIAALLGLRPTQLWPVSQESAPFLTGMWVVLITVLYLTCFRDKKNLFYEAALKQRREKKMTALKNLLFLEERRLAKQNGQECATGADDIVDVDEPPSARSIFDVIFEEVEEQETSICLGIDPLDPWYLRAVTLFKCRVKTELEEASAKTAEAQTLQYHQSLTPEQQILLDYKDGEKLREVLEFTRWKAVKRFGRHSAVPQTALKGFEQFDGEYLKGVNGRLAVVDKRILKEGEQVLLAVRAAQRKAIWYIIDVLKPVLPTYGAGLLVTLLARTFEAPLWATTLPAFKMSLAKINSEAKIGEFGFGPDILQEALGHAAAFLIGFAFSRPVEMLASHLADSAARDFSAPLQTAVMSAIMKQDTEYFDFNGSSKLQNRLDSDTNELVENLLWVPRQIFEHFFRVVQRMTVLYFCAPSMLWACVCFNVPIFSAIMFATMAPLRRLTGQRDRGSRKTSADTAELLQNIKTVRQFSMEPGEKAKYSLGNTNRNVVENRIRVLESLAHNFRFAAHICGEIYVIYIALSLVVEGAANTEDAMVASTVGMWLQHDFKNLMETLPKLLKVMRPVRRVASLLASTPRIEEDPEKPTTKLKPERFKGHVEFKNTTFSYPTERQKQVLGGLSFTAEPGQKVAFVGKAGCGKSTAMDLLQRFYTATGGEILIDGQPIEEYDTQHLRKHCGVVSQNNVLFSRSIYENIVYGMDDPPGPESDQFKEVCCKAEAWEFINKFPNKQYTQLGEKGVKLSGGQKQRIAIARVIIREPTFLFLDEATSALDAINEKSVQSALDEMLKQFQGVAIVVAHRLTTICNCDKIVVLGDDGTKVEEGTHEQLLQVPKRTDTEGKPVAGPGLYHTLWDTQQVEGISTGETRIPKNNKKVEEMEREIASQQQELRSLRNEVLWLRHTQQSSQHRRSRSLPESPRESNVDVSVNMSMTLSRRDSGRFENLLSDMLCSSNSI